MGPTPQKPDTKKSTEHIPEKVIPAGHRGSRACITDQHMGMERQGWSGVGGLYVHT